MALGECLSSFFFNFFLKFYFGDPASGAQQLLLVMCQGPLLCWFSACLACGQAELDP